MYYYTDKKIRTARAIYYSEQQRKYKDYEKKIDALNLRAEFNAFKKTFKCKYQNKVYYYFFKKINEVK